MAENLTPYSERDSSGVSLSQDESPTDGSGNDFSGTSLSMDFSAPLTGQARSERVKQMANAHPAYTKMRNVQEVLYKIQTSLRRMPGVSAAESDEIIDQLQNIGQVVSQETTQLIDAIANLSLDHEQTGKHYARMTIDHNVIKADVEDRDNNIRKLKKDVDEERQKRIEAESEIKRIGLEMTDLSSEFSDFKDKVRNISTPDSTHELVESVEAMIDHLEQQMSGRKSMWLMKHTDPREFGEAIGSMAPNVPDKGILARSLSSLRMDEDFDNHAPQPPTNGGRGRGQAQRKDWSRQQHNEIAHIPPRAPSAFQHADRPRLQSPLFSPLQAGPPRAPSTRPMSRPFHGWGASQTNGGGPQTRAASSNALVSPSFNRAPSRRGFQTQPRYRGNAQEFRPSIFADAPPSRPTTAFGNGRDHYSNSGRNPWGGRGMDGYEGGHGGGREVNGIQHPSNAVGPLIHLTERSVTAWTANVTHFYAVIRKFVDGHASMPLPKEDHHLEGTNIWGILLRTYSPLSEMEGASYLEYHLRDQSAKKCLVTRVIIDYVVNLVWVPTAWKGADPKTSAALDEVEAHLQQTVGLPSSARQPLLDRQAAILDDIMKNFDPSGDFYKTKLEEIAGTLLTSLQPILNPRANPTEAYGDLLAVADRAWDLSSKILTSRLTFDFRFPEVGSRFSSQSMVSIWPADLEPAELQARHWRVAMVTTPVITCRNDTGSNISAHSVSLADVICMM